MKVNCKKLQHYFIIYRLHIYLFLYILHVIIQNIFEMILYLQLQLLIYFFLLDINW